MQWARPIIQGFRHSLTNKGRMARNAYWQFVPVALIPPVAFALNVNWFKVHPWHGMVNLLLLFLFSLPLLNATARRLRDAGEDAGMAILPFAPFVILWLAYQSVLWVGVAIASVGGVWIIFVWVLALILLVPLHLFALGASLIAISSVLGHCLLPSLPGPNPHEVTP